MDARRVFVPGFGPEISTYHLCCVQFLFWHKCFCICVDFLFFAFCVFFMFLSLFNQFLHTKRNSDAGQVLVIGSGNLHVPPLLLSTHVFHWCLRLGGGIFVFCLLHFVFPSGFFTGALHFVLQCRCFPTCGCAIRAFGIYECLLHPRMSLLFHFVFACFVLAFVAFACVVHFVLAFVLFPIFSALISGICFSAFCFSFFIL